MSISAKKLGDEDFLESGEGQQVGVVDNTIDDGDDAEATDLDDPESAEEDEKGFYQIRPDLLYEADDNQPINEFVRQTSFILEARVFLEKELKIALQHHEIELIDGEDPDEIVKSTLVLIEEMAEKNCWLASMPAKAAMRIALKKVLYFRYNKNFELSGLAKFRLYSKFPGNPEQMQRNVNLLEAIKLAGTDEVLASRAMKLTNLALKMRILPEGFNRQGYKNLQCEAVNDLAVNWLFWYLDKSGLGEDHKALLVLLLGKAVDQQTLIEEYAKISSLDALNVLRDLQQVFQEAGDEQFQNFLRRPKVDGKHGVVRVASASADVKPDRQVDQSIRRDALFSYKRDLLALSPDVSSDDRSITLKYANVMAARAGNLTARNNFAETLLKLSWKRAVETRPGLFPLEDKMSEANLAVLRNAIAYDLRCGYKPATYFSYWIRHTVTRAVADKASAVRIPVHIQDKLAQFKKLRKAHPEMSQEELLLQLKAEGAGERFVNHLKNSGSLYGQAKSMEEPFGNVVDGATFGEMLADEGPRSQLLDLVENKNFAEKVTLAIGCLPPSLQIILRLRAGLIPGFEGEKCTLAEVGEIFGVSRERIRQLQNRIWLILANGRNSGLRNFLCRDEVRLKECLAEEGLSEEEMARFRILLDMFLGSSRKKVSPDFIDKYLAKLEVDLTVTREKFFHLKGRVEGFPEYFGYQNVGFTKSPAHQIFKSLITEEALPKEVMDNARGLAALNDVSSRADWTRLMEVIYKYREDHPHVQTKREVQQKITLQKEVGLIPDAVCQPDFFGDGAIIQLPEPVQEEKMVIAAKPVPARIKERESKIKEFDLQEIAGATNKAANDILKGLDLEQRKIAEAILIQGRSNKEIADQLSVPLGKVLMISAKVKMLLAE